MNVRLIYAQKSAELARSYLPYYKWYTIIGSVLFLMFLPSIFGYFIKMGFIGALGLLIVVILNGVTQMYEADANTELLDELIKN